MSDHPLPTVLETYTLSEPQLAAALARGGDVAVTAGAGTGKTRTLVGRYLALLATGLPLRQIVAVTFTRKAAREMRNRIRQEIGRTLRRPDLDDNERRRWQTAYSELDAARIGTIHNLCGEILRAHPAEAGTDPQFFVLDETQAALRVQDAVEAALVWAVNVPPARLAPLFDLLTARPLQDLIATLLGQRQATGAVVDALPAAAISAHWQQALAAHQAETIANLLAQPEVAAARHLLAANHASNPQDKAEIQRQTAVAALRALDDTALDERPSHLAALANIDLRGGSQKNWPGGKKELDAVKNALRTLRDRVRERPLLASPLNEQDAAIAAAMPAIYALYATASRLYRAQKDAFNALDFDDLEIGAIRLLANHPAIAAYWQSQVQALLVDEFQDTNAQQRRLIRLLCPQPGRLFIVGDAKQSIYRFRGADVTVFEKEKQQIAAGHGRLLNLDTSYRAHAALLAAMNHLLRPVLGDDGPARPSYVAPFAPLQPGGRPPVSGLNAPFVEFHLALGRKAEAMPVAAGALAARLQQLHAAHNFDYGEMAILCRSSSAFSDYENALDAAAIPYLTVAGKGFYKRPEIRDVLNALQAIADPHDDLALVGLLRSPAIGLSDLALYQLVAARLQGDSLWQTAQRGDVLIANDENQRLATAVSLITDLNRQAGRTAVADVCKQFLDRTYYRAILRRAGRPRALRNVAKLLADIHTSELVSVPDFLEYAQALRDSGSRQGEARATGGGAVQIMSIHAAKGLEFPLVVLGDAGGRPPTRSDVLIDPALGILLPQAGETGGQATSYRLGKARADAQEAAEAARLLYVAVTRAEQMVLINGVGKLRRDGSLSWDGWLAQLLAGAGLDDLTPDAYDEAGANSHAFERQTIAADGVPVAVRAAIYEPGFASPAPVTKSLPAIEKAAPAAPTLLQLPYQTDQETAVSAAMPERVWQVVPTAQKTTAPAWVVGSLVHQALARWRFPGAGFDDWVAARARQFGLTDRRQLNDARRRTAGLLHRFRRHALCSEIGKANRRLHEVPYSYEADGRLHTGYIDLVYESDGVWTVVDYKTDAIDSPQQVAPRLTQTDYEQQLRRYGTAVQRLLSVTPRLKLVLLDVAGSMVVKDVDPAQDRNQS